MKFKNIIRYTAALAFPVALLGGCTGDFEELNTNPIEVNPSDLPFEAQFLEPMSYSYPNQQNLFQYWTNLQIDIFGGYFESPNGNFTNQRYDINRGHCGGMYENFMLHIINNTGRLIKQCDAEGKFDFSATMRIVQTYNLLDFTDAYGPVPFLSVFKTAGDPVQPSSFAYDTQKAVYEAARESTEFHKQVWGAAVDAARKECEEKFGVKFIHPDVSEFQKAVAPMYEDLKKNADQYPAFEAIRAVADKKAN